MFGGSENPTDPTFEELECYLSPLLLGLRFHKSGEKVVFGRLPRDVLNIGLGQLQPLELKEAFADSEYAGELHEVLFLPNPMAYFECQNVFVVHVAPLADDPDIEQFVHVVPLAPYERRGIAPKGFSVVVQQPLVRGIVLLPDFQHLLESLPAHLLAPSVSSSPVKLVKVVVHAAHYMVLESATRQRVKYYHRCRLC